MTARTMIEARRLAPSGTLNNLRIPGTSTIIPTDRKRPKEHPRNLLLIAVINPAFGYFRDVTAAKPIGTPTQCSGCAVNAGKNKGSMPLGSAAVDAHFWPKSSLRPIVRINWNTEITR